MVDPSAAGEAGPDRRVGPGRPGRLDIISEKHSLVIIQLSQCESTSWGFVVVLRACRPPASSLRAADAPATILLRFDGLHFWEELP